MKISKILLSAAIIVLAISSNGFCDGAKHLEKEELFSIYRNKLQELNLKSVNINNVKLEEFNVYNKKDMWDRNISEVWCENENFEMDIDPFSGKILRCYSNFLYEKRYGPNAQLFKGGAKPTKNKEEIIREAEKYVKIINGEIPKNVRFSSAPYNVSIWQGREYSYAGEWSVHWIRWEGRYEFNSGDCISVGIDEEYGLNEYRNDLFSEYVPPKSINISEDKAIEIGKTHKDKITRKGFKVEAPTSAKLRIAHQSKLARFNKNYIPRPKSYARLVWILPFHCIGQQYISDDEKLADYTYNIFIDAENGELF